MISHWISCLFYFFKDNENVKYFKFKNSWVNKYDLINEPWHVKYLTGFYWAIVTMITVGIIFYERIWRHYACFSKRKNIHSVYNNYNLHHIWLYLKSSSYFDIFNLIE